MHPQTFGKMKSSLEKQFQEIGVNQLDNLNKEDNSEYVRIMDTNERSRD
jgi:hypothetical protein